MGALCSEDYEKVFGKPKKWTLFPEDEEAYEAFRQTIMDSPHYVYDKKELPFTGVKVYGLDLYLLKRYIDQKKAEGKKLFYIKDETPGFANVLAFGYFSKNSQTFYLMANSLIRKTDFQQKMKKDPSLCWPVYRLQAKSEIRKCDAVAKDEQNQTLQLELFHPEGYRMIEDVPCSASIAAAYALGQEADFTKWKGMDGKKLAEVYSFYKGSPAELTEIKCLWTKLRSMKNVPPQIIEEEKNNHLLYDKIISPLIRFKEKESTKIDVVKREKLDEIHCFLKDDSQDSVDAEGFYNVQDGSIIVKAGSLFSTEVTSDFRYTAKDYQRRSFLKFNCSTKGSKYVLKKNCAFSSLEMATTFIIGYENDGYYLWKNEDGFLLGELIDEKTY